jgi:hypothetical protein
MLESQKKFNDCNQDYLDDFSYLAINDEEKKKSVAIEQQSIIDDRRRRSEKFIDEGRSLLQNGFAFSAISEFTKALVNVVNDEALESLCYELKAEIYASKGYSNHHSRNVENANRCFQKIQQNKSVSVV